MRYTAEATMEERALRDVEHWKDKIEVRLDNRQVFFLFFGSALVACLLFILGVIVGKRLESRGKAVAPEIEDPLALLDRVAATPRTTGPTSLPLPRALLPGVGTSAAVPVVKTAAVVVEAKATAKAPVAAVAVAAPKADGRYSLQLASFPDRAEAEAFAARFPGESTFIVQSEIPGKGVWHRVRIGDYASSKDAIAAKAAFETKHSVIAYVVGPR